MIFSSRRFFQKTNEQIQLYYLSTCFRSLFGRKWRHQKDISKLTDLYNSFETNSSIFLWQYLPKSSIVQSSAMMVVQNWRSFCTYSYIFFQKSDLILWNVFRILIILFLKRKRTCSKVYGKTGVLGSFGPNLTPVKVRGHSQTTLTRRGR